MVGGNALDFDGTDDEVKLSFVNIGDSAAWSLTAWIKMSADTAAQRTIYSEGNTGAEEYLFLYVDDTTNHAKFWIKDLASGMSSMESTTNVEDDAWHLITLVQRSKTDRELYVGTSSESTNTYDPGTLASNTASIGFLRASSWTADSFLGMIDDVRIYDYALSTGQIATLAASPPSACAPAVTSAVAEISPNDVITSSTANSFSYDIQATIGVGDTGVNKVAITVPGSFTVPASPVTDVLVGGVSVGPAGYTDNTVGNDISVDLTTKVIADTRITVLFNADAPITQDPTGVNFISTVDDSATGDSAQSTTMGDGDGDVADNDSWTVTTTDGGFAVLLVAVNKTTPTAQDAAKKTLIESWGYTVTLIEDTESQAAFDTAVATSDVAYISEEITSTNLDTKLTNACIGVVNDEEALADELGFASGNANYTTSTIDITNSSHYITSPFSIGSLTITTSAQSLNIVNGTIATGAQFLAVQPPLTGNSTLTVIEVDGTLTDPPGGTAAGRRVYLPWGDGTFDINALNTDGKLLMRRAIEWGTAGGACGAIGHWNFDEGTGQTAADSAGTNDGTLGPTTSADAEDPTWACVTGGNALDFDGTDDYVDIPPIGDGYSAITVSAWMKARTFASPENYNPIVAREEAGDDINDVFALMARDEGVGNEASFRIYVGAGNTKVTARSNIILSTDTWYHLVGTYDGADVRVYLDGIEKGNAAQSGTLSTEATRIALGKFSNNFYVNFDGLIDEVRIYDRALSPAEISALAASPPAVCGGTTTTIDNVAPPGSVTIGPGATITDLDNFSLVASSGTDTVTAATVTLVPAGAFNNIGQADITDVSGAAQCTAITNPVSNILSFTGCSIPVTTTITTFKVRITPRTHANMPVVPGASYAVTGTVTAFTSTNTQAGSDTGSAEVTVDNLSPSNVTGASSTPGDTQVTVNWTNPGSDFSNVLVLRNTATIVDVPTEGSSPAVDSTIGTSVVRYIAVGTSFIDTGLMNGTPYFYRIFAKDIHGNYADTGVEVSTTPSSGPAIGSCPAPSVVFADGFESGDLSAWDSSSTGTGDTIGASTVEVNTGTYSVRGETDSVADASAYVTKDFAGETTVVVQAYIYLDPAFAITGNVEILYFNAASPVLATLIKPDLTLQLWNQVAGENYLGTTTITKGVWHVVEMEAVINGTTSEARLWLDGNLEVEQTGIDLGLNPITRLKAVRYWSQVDTEANIVYFDDIVLCDQPMTASNPAVTSAVAEISPNDVTTSSTANAFSYDIKATMLGGDTGVNRVTITVPVSFGAPTVTDVLVNDVSVARSVTITGNDISIDLTAKVIADSRITVLFNSDAPITQDLIGVNFVSTVDDSGTNAAAQSTTEGNGDGDVLDANSWAVTTTNGLAVSAAVAEISPNDVVTSSTGNSFSYDIKATISGNDTGVNTVTITVPGSFGAPTITAVQVDGGPVAYTPTITGNDISIQLITKVTTSSKITIVFDADAPAAQDLTGVNFISTVDDSGTSEAAQATTEGDGDGNAGDNNSWTVTTTGGGGGGSCLAVDGNASTGSTTTNSLTISHTTAGTDRLMIVGITIDNNQYEVVSTVTYNSIALTFVGQETNDNDARVEIWQLSEAGGLPTGTHDVDITFDANLVHPAVAGVITFTGVDQTTPLGSFFGNQHVSSNPGIVTVNSANGEMVLGVFSGETVNSVVTNAPATERWNLSAGGTGETQYSAGSTDDGAASVSMVWSLGKADHWAAGGVSIKPAASCSGTAAVTSSGAEISPNNVTTSSTGNAFSYDILANISGAATGVNRITITVPGSFGAPTVIDVEVDGTPVAYSDIIAGNDISVDLTTKVTATSQLTVLFDADAPITQDLAGVDFVSTVDDSGTADAPQSTTEGNGDGDAGDSNSWTVFTTNSVGAGALSHWPLDETAGVTAADVESAHDGTYTNGPTLNQVGACSNSGTAAYFGGEAAGQYVVVPHHDDYLLDNGTISLWAKLDEFPNPGSDAEHTVFSKDSTNYDTGGHVDMRVNTDGTVEVRLQSDTASNYITSAAIPATTWVHLAFSWGAGGMKLYVDGGAPVTDPYSGGLGTTSGGIGNYEPIALGASQTNSDDLSVTPVKRWMKGYLDDVRIYDSALSAAEILALATCPPAPAVTSAVAEITVNNVVTLSTTNLFTYDIGVIIGSGDTGVNRVAITVPGSFGAPTISNVLVDGLTAAYTDNTSGNDISVDLTTKVTASSQITVVFDADAPTTEDLAGAGFVSTVDDSTTGDAAQATTEGNGDGDAADFNSWTVTTTGATTGGGTCDVDGSGFYIEAENFVPPLVPGSGSGSFLTQSSLAGYNGTGYTFSSGGNTNTPPDNERADYEVNFTTTGTFYVWQRGYSVDGGSDSVFIGLDGTWAGALNESGITDQWIWSDSVQTGVGTINVATTGLHTINLWVREPGHGVDGIYITQSSGAIPGGTSVGIPTGATIIDPNNCGSSNPAASAVAEISPNDVETSSLGNAFSYDIAVTIGAGDTGVDRVGITVPGSFGPGSVTDVLVDDVSVSFTDNTFNNDISVDLASKVTSSGKITILFSTDAPTTEDLTGVDFLSTVDDSGNADTPTATTEGNGDADAGDNDSWTVTTTDPVVGGSDPCTITVDGTASSASTDGGSSITISHSTSAGSDRLMLVGVSLNNDGNETITGVTYGGNALTLVGSVTESDDAVTEIWQLTETNGLATGTDNVVVTFSAALQRQAVAGVMTFTGVDQTTPLGTFASNKNDNVGPVTVTVGSATGELVFAVATSEDEAVTLTLQSPATEYWNVTRGINIGAGATSAGATSVTVDWNFGSAAPDHWSAAGVSIKPAQTCGGSGGTCPMTDVFIALENDDAEEAASGSMDLSSSDLEMVEEGSKQTVGLRFVNLDIDQGADITNAYLEFTGNEADSVATDLTFHAQDIDTAPIFSSTNGDISGRTPTTASVSWNGSSTPAMVAWSTDGTYQSPDMSAIVEEVTSRTGWTNNNAIAFIITGTAGSKRVADAHGTGTNVKLHFECSAGGGGGGPPVDHFAISHDGNGINCQAENITITAHESGHSVETGFNGTIKLSTTTSHGDWSVITGAGSLINNGRGAGHYAFHPSDSGVVVLGLRDTFVETTNVNADHAIWSEDSGEDDDIDFARAGFNFLADSANNTIGTQIGGKDSDVAPGAQTLELQAVKTSDDTGACEAALVGATNVELAFECENPTSCSTRQLIINGTDLPQNADGTNLTYNAASMDFGNNTDSTATFTMNYPEVGEVRLHARYRMSPSAEWMLGGSNLFVVRPFAFSVSATGNPGAASPAGLMFTSAGTDFSANVSAVLWEAADDTDNDGIADDHDDINPGNNANLMDNAIAFNYGQETSAEQVSLTALLDQPAGGNNPGLSGGTSISIFNSGIGTTNTIRYDEVGIIEISAAISDGNYLGIGVSETGDVHGNSGYVGRFNPAQYAVTSSSITPACSATFTYARQPFTGTMTIEAQAGAAAGNVQLANYRAGFVTLDPATELVFINDQTTAAYDAKTVTYNQNFDSGTTGEAVLALQFRWDMPEQVPTSSTVQNTEVTDEVTTLAAAPVGIGSSPTRFGRAAFGSAVGSELVNLGVPFHTEYYVDASTGYVTNVNDFCSSGGSLSFSNFAGNLGAGETCVEDSGSPGVSNAGCLAPGPVTQRYDDPLIAGEFNLFLDAPGAGNDGSGTVDANVPDWLEFDWDTGLPGIEDPSGRFTFGINGGNKNQVYRRELY